MALRHGALIYAGGTFFLDRVDTAGISSFGIKSDIVKETGDPLNVGIVRDTPDLTFDVTSLDMTCELEALICGQNPTTLTSGVKLDPSALALPLDIVAPIRQSLYSTTTIRGSVIPYLYLDTLSYKFAVKQNSQVSATFKGDAAYYTPGTPRYERHTVSGTGPYNFASNAAAYVDTEFGTYFALSVCYKNPGTGESQRMFPVFDFTDTATGVTMLAAAPTPPSGVAYPYVDICYGSVVNTADTWAQQPSPAGSPPTGKPPAVRAKNVDVFIAPPGATPVFTRLNRVQTLDVSRKVTLEANAELGNPNYFSQDYDTPTVSGTIGLLPDDANDLYSKLITLTGTTNNQVIGPFSSIPVQMEVHVTDPATGSRLKTIYVPDARFTIPGLQGKVAQKVNVSLPFNSDTAVLQIFNGQRPGGSSQA